MSVRFPIRGVGLGIDVLLKLGAGIRIEETLILKKFLH
jgi:hypothetical protein